MDESPALRPYRRDNPRLWLHAGLLLATFVTAMTAGAWWWEGLMERRASWPELLDLSRLSHGMTYASLLLLILGAHEMGHYFACRYYGVSATLPFFIPGPPMIVGTFGAVIRIRGPIPSRKALFDIAAAGPIAGFVVAFPVLVWGIAHATVTTASAPIDGGGIGSPLCSWIFEHLFHGDAQLQAGSVYGAAWVGMLVTSMNLFPVGQLDGGHALFAVAPRAHRLFSWVTIGAVAALVVVQSFVYRSPSSYTLWLVILFVLKGRHPRLIDESEALGAGRIGVAVVLAVIFVLTFIPAPLLLD